MSTTLNLKDTQTVPQATASYRDMGTANGVGGLVMTLDTVPAAPAERQFKSAGIAYEFWSERVAAPFTLSGSITFTFKMNGPATFTGKARARLYKITAGGSNIETFIGQADTTTDVNTGGSASYTLSFTPSPSVELVTNERFILRVSAFPTGSSGTSYGTGAPTFSYGNAAAGAKIVFTDTFTLRANGSKLFLRSTTTIGIASFMDLLADTFTSAQADAIVNTAAGGTDIQWTKTAGGAAAEWLSKRVAAPGWRMTDPALVTGTYYNSENNASANCGSRLRIYRRRPDGTELLVLTSTYNSELGVGSPGGRTFSTSTQVLAQATNFAEDDRVVIRVFITNVGTMAAGFTCDLAYNVFTATTGNSFVTLLESPDDWKAESDPAATSRIPGAQTMSGIGN